MVYEECYERVILAREPEREGNIPSPSSIYIALFRSAALNQRPQSETADVVPPGLAGMNRTPQRMETLASDPTNAIASGLAQNKTKRVFGIEEIS